ncbi:MAG TPA: hypothetical protein VGS13_04130 [Stellaceae bacterium]|nr:hypothetical protein [Stellaceae bacterium]
MPDAARIKAVCEACFDANEDDCSKFARAVAAGLGVSLAGSANNIVDTIEGVPGWVALDDGVAAADAAENGKFVLGGLRGSDQANPSEHGHVVVVVGPPLAHGAYPSAYWGRLGGGGQRNQTVNFAWNAEDRDSVSYASHDL